MTKTLILYKADSLDAEGWEQRLLLPEGNFTDTLAESIDFSGRLPQLGERVDTYQSDSAGFTSHWREGNWVVTRVEHFSSFDTDTRIVLCWCSYQPINSEWKPVKRGQPAHELLGSEQPV